MDSNKRLIIRTTPRSGSNLLCHSLAQHPDVFFTGEYYNPDPERTLPSYWNNRMSYWNLTKLMYLEPIPCSTYADSFLAEMDKPLLSYNPICIFLYRENIEAQHQSYLRACLSGEWVKDVFVDPSKPFDDFIERVKITNTELINLCRYHISYEELISNWDEVISKILDIMKWKPMKLDKALQKQSANTKT